MIQKGTIATILAAGKSTRMKSSMPKVLVEICGKPILSWVIDSVKKSGISRIITVIGNNKEKIKDLYSNSGMEFVEQREQLGTGHAVKITKSVLGGFRGIITVLQGDMPLIKPETIRRLINKHKRQKADVTILTTCMNDPGSYGRILRGKDGIVKGIIEEADAGHGEREIKEINSGVYAFNAEPLFKALRLINQNNKKGEYYLTDVISVLHGMGKKIESLCVTDSAQMYGVNTQRELVRVTKIAQTEILDSLMSEGVTIVDPSNTLVEYGARIGSGTIVYPNTFIGRCAIVGKDCRIGPFINLNENIRLAEGCEIGYTPRLN